MQSSISELIPKWKKFDEVFPAIEEKFNRGDYVDDSEIAWMLMQVKRLKATADRSYRRRKSLRGLQKAHEALKHRNG